MKPDVIICLGKNLSVADAKEVMQARVNKAVSVFTKSKAKKMILSGGFYGDRYLSEAKYMWSLVGERIPPGRIILEEHSINTIENARFCRKIMDKIGFNSAVVVTSSWHLRRAGYIFTKTMEDKKLTFVPSGDRLKIFDYPLISLKESIALLFLRLKKSAY